MFGGRADDIAVASNAAVSDKHFSACSITCKKKKTFSRHTEVTLRRFYLGKHQWECRAEKFYI